MKAVNHPDFNPQFPELFGWHLLLGGTVSAAAIRIAERCRRDLRTPDRLYTPGLRMALVLIAEDGLILGIHA